MEKAINSLNNTYKKSNNYLLEKEYEQALKDETFKEIVGKLKLKREILINYTTTLEECSKQYSKCKNCPGLKYCENKIIGYAYLPKNDNGNISFSYRPCKYKKKETKKNKYKENMILYNIPEEIEEASFSKIHKTDKKRFDTIIWLTEFLKSYKENKNMKGLYLCGNFGCGKTYLISAMFTELAKENVKSAIVFWPEFLRDLKASFNSEYKNEFNTKFNQIKKIPLLLIDDLGAESLTAWSRDEILCTILQYRMENHLPTFITSNLNKEAMLNHLSFSKEGSEVIKAGRIMSRIEQLTEYKEMISKNLRK